MPEPTPPVVKKNRTGLKIAGGMAGAFLLGAAIFGVGDKTEAPATPAPASPAVTAPAPAPAPTAESTASTNVTVLKLVWADLDSTNQASLRDAWRTAKGDAELENTVVTMFMNEMTAIPTLTRAELREFLDWTLFN